MPTKVSAPGKVILLGEHAAVYGNPVLVASIDLETHVSVEKRREEGFILKNPTVGIENLKFTCNDTSKLKKEVRYAIPCDTIDKIYEKYRIEKSQGLKIEISSDIPVSSGLGSSASLSVSLVTAITKELGIHLEKKVIADLSWEVENIIHGKSSGVDPYAVTFGGVLNYNKGDYKKVDVKNYPNIIIGDTGIKKDTGNVVSDVEKLSKKYPKYFDYYLKAMRDIINVGEKSLKEGDLNSFGEIMNINHGLLSSIGVSCKELEELVWASRPYSLGAKLCGAGCGGIMIALEGDSNKVSEAIGKAGGRVIRTKICDVGVRIKD